MSDAARKTFELLNDVQPLDQADDILLHDADEQRRILAAAPWKTESVPPLLSRLDPWPPQPSLAGPSCPRDARADRDRLRASPPLQPRLLYRGASPLSAGTELLRLAQLQPQLTSLHAPCPPALPALPRPGPHLSHRAHQDGPSQSYSPSAPLPAHPSLSARPAPALSSAHPQVIHARSGGIYEIMGLLQGKVLGRAFVVMDTFALPVQGTETRVNAAQEADGYMIAHRDGSQLVRPLPHSRPLARARAADAERARRPELR